MLSDRKLTDLVELMQRRYADWDGFDHPPFVADEISYKQATIEKASTLFNQEAIDGLLAAGDYDTILQRLTTLVQNNNLLWRRVPSQGDTAVLTHPQLDKAAFCMQIRNLLYGDQPTAERLGNFSDYLSSANLPNKWPFLTYLLFICQPQQEIFVRPRPLTWFLRFMGAEVTAVSSPPTATLYTNIQHYIAELTNALQPYRVHNMVDVQSFIWVCYRESRARIGHLTAQGQVDLDVPRTEPYSPGLEYEVEATAIALRESSGNVSNDAADDQPPFTPTYTATQFITDTSCTRTDLQLWKEAINRKGQIVFYGPPGIGKTFIAQKLAQHLVGSEDGFVELVQFHPAFAYEDFIQGIRPLTHGDGSLRYEMVPGRFLKFCQLARQKRNTCVFIIDEINRADIAAVFGELLFLLEYRGQAIQLAGGKSFSIPANVQIIGTMNTADRSLALVDYALRRRFAFIHLAPNMEVLRQFHVETGFPATQLIAILEHLNRQIDDPHYSVGHSFFMDPLLSKHLPAIWRLEIEPYLEEYFFDQPERVDPLRWSAIEGKFPAFP